MSESADLLPFPAFEEELRHVARFITATATVNPLDAVVTAIRENPALNQARLLTRMLAACIGRQVTFRRAEVATFDREHLGLAVALMDARAAGTLNETDWVRAADDADAAERDFNG